MIPYINFSYKNKLLSKSYNNKFKQFFKSGRYINGSELKIFEDKFSKYLDNKYSIGVASGTCALHLAIKHIRNLDKRNEVITVSNSFIATASSIIIGGCKPVFVDVANDMNIDCNKIEEAINKKTLAIMPVHLTGRPALMDKILKIAKKYNLYVIEDAAQAIGSKYKNKKVGSFGHISAFSLHPLKNLNAFGDGGIISTNSKKIYDYFYKARNHGLKNRDSCEFWSFNCRLDELQAGFLNEQIKILDKLIELRIKIANFYNNELDGIVFVPKTNIDEYHSYQTYVIRAEKRDKLKEYLNKNGVEALIHYPNPIHLQKVKGGNFKKYDLSRTEKYAKEILSLPLYAGLNKKNQLKIVNLIKKFYN
ncbi:MAG: hypothetical protein CMM44_11960 [Rhodospirillaceae bacterium]|nr:hypothetical protein [Rhodospirillaceae bacterium]